MKTRRILIVEEVAEKLEKLSNESDDNGYLVTWINDDTTLVTGCLKCKNSQSKSRDLETLTNYIPGGLTVGGQVGRHDQSQGLDLCITSNKEGHLRVELNGCETEYEKVPCSEAKHLLGAKTIPFYIEGKVETTLRIDKSYLKIEPESLLSNKLSYLLENQNMLIHHTSEFDTSLCKSLLDKNTHQSRTPLLANTVHCKIMTRTAGTSKHAPVIENLKDEKFVKFPVCFEMLCFVEQQLPLNKLYSHLRSALHRQINSFNACLKHEGLPKCGLPRLLYFQPAGWCHPVTVCYPSNKSDSDLQDFRKSVLHEMFMLPCTKPHFRKNNAIALIPRRDSLLLNNTHEGLHVPKITDGKLYLVKGTYGYHHYMQDHIDDNGWGCAYRSLQTVVSWFRHQAYTDKNIPTHKEIQQILVDTGDKPKEFVGTRKWIGSIEVSTILNQYLGVTSKIMSVGQGSELSSRGRELAMHFANQGTPVMIGGGVLAHTILGVCFSETSGETRFLILDPHYTGGEDLKVIQDKGWCGWKGQNFWNQTAFYNLCLPQVPETY